MGSLSAAASCCCSMMPEQSIYTDTRAKCFSFSPFAGVPISCQRNARSRLLPAGQTFSNSTSSARTHAHTHTGLFPIVFFLLIVPSKLGRHGQTVILNSAQIPARLSDDCWQVKGGQKYVKNDAYLDATDVGEKSNNKR